MRRCHLDALWLIKFCRSLLYGCVNVWYDQKSGSNNDHVQSATILPHQIHEEDLLMDCILSLLFMECLHMKCITSTIYGLLKHNNIESRGQHNCIMKWQILTLSGLWDLSGPRLEFSPKNIQLWICYELN